MNQVQLQLPPLTKINKILMITTGSLFLLNSILTSTAGFSLISILGLSAASLSSGLVYQLLTYPLIEKQLLAVIFNALLLWFLGSELESRWGSKRYFQFLMVATLTAGLVYVLLGASVFAGSAVYGFPLMGLQGIAASLCLAYAILYPERSFMFMMIFPMKAKWFCALLIAMELYTGFFSPMAALAWGHLAAMLGGFVMMVWFSRKRIEQKKVAGNFTFKMEKKKGKAHLSLVEEEKGDDENRPPKYWQ